MDILKYKSEPISASNHSLECGMAIRPGARAATVVRPTNPNPQPAWSLRVSGWYYDQAAGRERAEDT